MLGFITVTGWTSLGLGAAFALFSNIAGRQAKTLEGVHYIENLSELRHLVTAVNVLPLLIAVSGRVLAKNPVKCELSKEEGAIVELREERKTERRGGVGFIGGLWLADTEPLRHGIKECTQWSLSDGTGPFIIQLPVVEGWRAQGDHLQMSGDVWAPAQEGLMEQVLGELAGRKALGTRTYERYLPLGTVITAVGELATSIDQPGAFKGAFRTGTGQLLVLRPPTRGGPFILSRTPFPQLLYAARAHSATLARISEVFTAIGVAMFSLKMMHKGLVWWRVRKIRARVEEARRQREYLASLRGSNVGTSNSTTATNADGSDEEDDDIRRQGMCVVCYETPASMVYPNCGHLVVCEECVVRAGSALQQQCPMCRVHGRPVKVYTA